MVLTLCMPRIPIPAWLARATRGSGFRGGPGARRRVGGVRGNTDGRGNGPCAGHCTPTPGTNRGTNAKTCTHIGALNYMQLNFWRESLVEEETFNKVACLLCLLQTLLWLIHYLPALLRTVCDILGSGVGHAYGCTPTSGTNRGTNTEKHWSFTPTFEDKSFVEEETCSKGYY